MITICCWERCPRLTITNDKTFEEICIECRDYSEEREILLKLVENLLENK